MSTPTTLSALHSDSVESHVTLIHILMGVQELRESYQPVQQCDVHGIKMHCSGWRRALWGGAIMKP